MGSLDQDVKLLRTKLQNSVQVPNARRSTKRRWSTTAADQDVASPAKVIRIAETVFMQNKIVEK